MTLKQIDDRLNKFLDYQSFIIYDQAQVFMLSPLRLPEVDPKYLIEIFNQTGYLFCGKQEEPTQLPRITFDEWLFARQYYELVIDFEEVTAVERSPEPSLKYAPQLQERLIKNPNGEWGIV